MNIGIFTETYYPQTNGVVTSIRALEKELNNLGHRVYIFTTTYPDIDPVPRVFRLPSMPFWAMPSHRIGFTFSTKVLKIIKDLDLDIIHTQTEFTIGLLGKTASKIFNIPNVHTYHTMYEDYVHYILKGYVITPKMAQEFSKIFCNGAEAVIAPSQKVYDVLYEYGVTRDIEIIPTGIDLQPFETEQFDSSENIKHRYGLENCPIILSLGRLGKEKSVDVVIKAMPELLKKIPNAKLLIVGEGPYKHNLETLISDLGIQSSVVFAGQQPWADVPKFYHLSDVFITASITETQGLTYAEAMAAKVPIVAKKDLNIDGLLKDNVNSRIFSDNSQLPDILYSALTDTQKSKAMSERAFKDIQPFSSKRFGQKVSNLYERVIQIHDENKIHHMPSFTVIKKPLKPLNRIRKIPVKAAATSIKKVKDISIKYTFHSKK